MHLFIARYKQIGEKQTHILITEKKYVSTVGDPDLVLVLTFVTYIF